MFAVQIPTDIWTFLIFPIYSKIKIDIKFSISHLERTWSLSVSWLVTYITQWRSQRGDWGDQSPPGSFKYLEGSTGWLLVVNQKVTFLYSDPPQKKNFWLRAWYHAVDHSFTDSTSACYFILFYSRIVFSFLYIHTYYIYSYSNFFFYLPMYYIVHLACYTNISYPLLSSLYIHTYFSFY